MTDHGHKTTFEDAWDYWYSIEGEYGVRVTARIHPPRELGSGRRLAATVWVEVDPANSPGHKPVARSCAIGGTRGARTVPAGLIRALRDLCDVLEDRKSTAEQAAMF